MNLKEKLNNLIAGSIIGGILGALGGTDNSSKLFRRFSLPLSLGGLAWSHLHHWSTFCILLMIPILHIGYGIPSPDDEGSWLGRFWFKIFKSNLLLSNIATRGTIGSLLAWTLFPIILIKHNYLIGIIGIYLIKFVFALLSWRDLGGFEFQGKRLLWSEFIPYSIVALVTLFLIYF